MSTLLTPPLSQVSTPAVTEEADLMTAADFVRLHENDRVELVRGEVVKLPMPHFMHGKICGTIARLIGNYAADHNRGHVATNDTFVQVKRNPDTIRGGDVVYYSYQRLPKGAIPKGLLPIPPCLVVEVRSPSDTWTEVFIKIGEYLSAGVQVVVVLDEASTTASVYRPTDLQRTFNADEELAIPDLLPGFSVRVQQLFE